MIGYITVGTNDLPRAVAFYDALFARLGGSRAFETDRGIGWGFGPTGAAFGVLKPFDGQPASIGNGVMVALAVADTKMVDALYTEALKLGARDDGPPGLRGDNFYAGYFRDLDGNKLCAYYMG